MRGYGRGRRVGLWRWRMRWSKGYIETAEIPYGLFRRIRRQRISRRKVRYPLPADQRAEMRAMSQVFDVQERILA